MRQFEEWESDTIINSKSLSEIINFPHCRNVEILKFYNMYNDDDLEWKMIRLYPNLFNIKRRENAVCICMRVAITKPPYFIHCVVNFRENLLIFSRSNWNMEFLVNEMIFMLLINVMKFWDFLKKKMYFTWNLILKKFQRKFWFNFLIFRIWTDIEFS